MCDDTPAPAGAERDWFTVLLDPVAAAQVRQAAESARTTPEALIAATVSRALLHDTEAVLDLLDERGRPRHG